MDGDFALLMFYLSMCLKLISWKRAALCLVVTFGFWGLRRVGWDGMGLCWLGG